MIGYYVSVPLILLALLAGCAFLQKKKSVDVISRVMKISAIVYITFIMLNMFLPDFLIRSHLDATIESLRSSGAIGHSILRWLNMASFVVIPLAVFNKNKYFEKIASYFCLPVALINFAFTYKYAGLQTVPFFSDSFKSFLINEGFRLAFFAILCISQIVTLVLLTVKNWRGLRFGKKEIPVFILITVGVIHISMPIYALLSASHFMDLLSRWNYRRIIFLIPQQVIRSKVPFANRRCLGAYDAV